ncbi:hypothetical protein ACWEFJ_08910 [Actinosynnema sp. NPDC004786]
MAEGAAFLKPAWVELRGDGQLLLLRPSDGPTAWLINPGAGRAGGAGPART